MYNSVLFFEAWQVSNNPSFNVRGFAYVSITSCHVATPFKEKLAATQTNFQASRSPTLELTGIATFVAFENE